MRLRSFFQSLCLSVSYQPLLLEMTLLRGEWIDTPSDHEAETLNQKTAIMDHKAKSQMLFDCGSLTPKETFCITHGDFMNTAATQILMSEAFVVLLPNPPPPSPPGVQLRTPFS